MRSPRNARHMTQLGWCLTEKPRKQGYLGYELGSDGVGKSIKTSFLNALDVVGNKPLEGYMRDLSGSKGFKSQMKQSNQRGDLNDLSSLNNKLNFFAQFYSQSFE